jgi:hypothetical protein
MMLRTAAAWVDSARFAWGLHAFLRGRLSLREAEEIIRRRVETRELHFLSLVERAIFASPRSPYRLLLALAGCEMSDLRDMVRAKGLEPTLRALRDAGVYVTFEEFRGRRPIVRGGREVRADAAAFDNPLLRRYYRAASGGTTGGATEVRADLTHAANRAAQVMVAYAAHGLLEAPMALWRGTLPDGSGISNILRECRFGHVPDRWFSPAVAPRGGSSLKHRLATAYIVLSGRLHGLPIPWPEPVRLDDAGTIARWMHRTIAARGAALLRCHVSMAVRVAVAARDLGLDLAGATFMGGGEPPTPGKVREITRSGARWIPVYSFSEAGSVGFGCARPADGNDIHVFTDALAIIQHPRPVPQWGLSVNAFYFTTLLPTAPKVLLNVESDDYGIVESRSCGCPLERYGFGDHLRHIFSFSKLTSEGVTIMGSEMIHLLEEVLPARFGGTPLDYQLTETEDAQGFTRLTLLVSPRVDVRDETLLVEAINSALSTRIRTHLAEAKAVRVQRAEPVWTDRGKLLPLNLPVRR